MRRRVAVPVAVLALAPAVAIAAIPTTGKGARRKPNGKIAFVATGGGGQAVFVANPDGSSRKRITGSRTRFTADPSWSPDGRRLVFASLSSTGAAWDLYVVRADGRRLHRIAKGGTDPAWSPDGRRIAFVASNRGIATVRADGSGRKRVIKATADVYYQRPAWSPNGRRLAVETTHRAIGSDQTNVEVIDVARGTATRVTSSGLDYQPDWSPDGRELVFHTHQSAAAGIHVVNVDGSDERSVSSGINDHEPTWSPDGRKILFTRYNAAKTSSALYVMSAGGANQRRVSKAGFPHTPDWGRRARR
jgi:TolB protein